MVVVPGVRVTAPRTPPGRCELRIAGSAAARGRIEVTGRGRLRGRLGGRRVRARLANRPPRAGAGLGATFARTATVTPPSARP